MGTQRGGPIHRWVSHQESRVQQGRCRASGLPQGKGSVWEWEVVGQAEVYDAEAGFMMISNKARKATPLKSITLSSMLTT